MEKKQGTFRILILDGKNIFVLKSDPIMCHSSCPWKSLLGFYCSLFKHRLQVEHVQYTKRCFECVNQENKEITL